MTRAEKLAEEYAKEMVEKDGGKPMAACLVKALLIVGYKDGYAAAVAELRSEEANKFARHHHENTICIPHSDWADWLERPEKD